MNLETALYDIVKDVAGGRIYPGRLPEESTYPAIAYYGVGGVPLHDQQGYIRNTRVRFDVWGESFDDVVLTAGALTEVLDGNHDGFSAIFAAEMDVNDAETGLFRRVTEFSLWGN